MTSVGSFNKQKKANSLNLTVLEFAFIFYAL